MYRGTIKCDILLIGEAPGFSENEFGVPFYGPAGDLLLEMLKSAKILAHIENYTECFTNVIACIPKNPEDPTSKTSQPPKEAIVGCTSRLVELIELAEPKIVVCVGKLAEDVMSSPEIYFELTDLAQNNIFRITHPAAILRAERSTHAFLIEREVDDMAARLRNCKKRVEEKVKTGAKPTKRARPDDDDVPF